MISQKKERLGGEQDQDLYIFTGSVFEEDGMGYIFYTGHNPHFPEKGKNQEVIMMAESKDFQRWAKVKDFSLSAPDCFEPHDFRDPFVFINEACNYKNKACNYSLE